MPKTLAPLSLLTALLLTALPQSGLAAGIYSCMTTSGQNVTSDRPIPNCRDAAQRVLNRDGSTRDTLRAEPTEAERQETLARQRNATNEREQAELARNQVKNWLARYPSAQALEAERNASLQPYQTALSDSQKRLQGLEQKRDALQAQANGQKKAGHPVTPRLSANIELQTGMASSQRVVVQNQQLEMQRIAKRYSELQSRLQPYWPAAPAVKTPGAADTTEP